MAESEPAYLVEVTRPLRGVWSPALVLGACTLALIATRASPLGAGWLFGLTVLAGLFGSLVRRQGPARAVGGPIACERRGLVRDGELLVASDDMEGLEIVAEPAGRASIRLWQRSARRPWELAAESRAQAERALATLGRAPGRVAGTFETLSRLYALERGERFAARLGLACLGALAAALVVAHAWIAAGVAIALPLVALALGGARATVRLGSDGLVVRWLGQERVVSLLDIARITSAPTSFWAERYTLLRLELEDGGRLLLPVAEGEAPERSSDLERALRAAMERAKTAGARAPAALERGGRTHRAWVSELRAAARGAPGLRTPAYDGDDWLRVAEDPHQPEVLRASAALAALSADPALRIRVAELAAATSSAGLRAALAGAAEDADDEALAQLLEALEREPPAG